MVTHNHMYKMAGPCSTPKLKPKVSSKRVVTTAFVAGEGNVRTMFLKLGSTKGCQRFRELKMRIGGPKFLCTSVNDI